MDAKRAEAKLNRQAAVEEAGAEKAAAEAKKQAAPKQQQQTSGPSNTDKVTQESCETFDVYDCDVTYPKLFETCRDKKRACAETSEMHLR